MGDSAVYGSEKECRHITAHAPNPSCSASLCFEGTQTWRSGKEQGRDLGRPFQNKLVVVVALFLHYIANEW